jgi:hypothetical protein
MKFTVVKFTNIKRVTSDISFESWLIDMRLKTISSKPDSLTLWSSLIHVRIGEAVAISSNEQSGPSMQLTLHHQPDTIK